MILCPCVRTLFTKLHVRSWQLTPTIYTVQQARANVQHIRLHRRTIKQHLLRNTMLTQHSRAALSAEVLEPLDHEASRAAKRRRRGGQNGFTCPACGNTSFQTAKLIQHMAKCCSDLLSGYSPRSHMQTTALQSTSTPLPQHSLNDASLSEDNGTVNNVHSPPNLLQPQQHPHCSNRSDHAGQTAHVWHEVQQLLVAAEQQEAVLRRQVLHLLHTPADTDATPALSILSSSMAADAADYDSEHDDADSSSEVSVLSMSGTTSSHHTASGTRYHRTPQEVAKHLGLPLKRYALHPHALCNQDPPCTLTHPHCPAALPTVHSRCVLLCTHRSA